MQFRTILQVLLETHQDQILCAPVLPELAVRRLWQILSVMRKPENVLRPRSSCHPNMVPRGLVDCQFQTEIIRTSPSF